MTECVEAAAGGRLPNQVYYFDVAAGTWEGEFEFEIRSARGFQAAPGRPLFKFLGWTLEWAQRLMGPGVIYSDISPYPNEGDAGVSRSKVQIRKWGIVLYHMTGEYVLNKDGTNVDITLKERFGPIPLLFRNTKGAHACINPDGMGGRYKMTLLGDEWEGTYHTWPSRTRVRAVYESSWGWARETIKQCQSRSIEGQKYVMRPASPLVPKHQFYDRLEKNEAKLRDARMEFERKRDSRAVFAMTYEIISKVIKEEFDPARFTDPDWVVQLAEKFADRYVSNVIVTQRPGPAWCHVLEAILDRRSTVLEDMMFCLVAHIVYDLPLTLRDLGFDDGKSAGRLKDYHRVNEYMEIAIGDIQEQIAERYNPRLHWLDALGKNYDENLTNYGLRLGRAAAWYNALRLQDSATQKSTLASLDRSVLETIVKVRRSVLAQIIRFIISVSRTWPRSSGA
jgi:hypothetical protein